MEKIKIIAIIGKAGSGKDTIATELAFQYPELVHPIISCTSRPPREREVQGEDYFFLSKEEFEQKECNGEMLESTTFNSWYYGTSYDSLSKSKVNIGVFNPDGIRKLLKDGRIDIYVCYVRARDKTRLLRQLNREDNPDVQEIVRRFYTDGRDFEDLDFMVDREFTNEHLEDIPEIVESIGSVIQDLDNSG